MPERGGGHTRGRRFRGRRRSTPARAAALRPPCGCGTPTAATQGPQLPGSPLTAYGRSPGSTIPSARASRWMVAGLFSEFC